ncbi:hypothetical protein R1sor_018820 [Riccia sorocarpa]|uniref:tRNA-uridine aminocarboxypropyltransferase n=1 Tax=Riccia sorocarpa TaxID=122646 RepID=A0ABD3IAU6_9MARC
MATMGTKHVEKDVSSIEIPSWIILQSDVGLLFPSEHALDLGSVDLGRSLGDGDSAAGYARKPPSQLIVLDGTWSKAKRLFYVNPWLHNLPHHRLPPSKGSSRYGIIRKEPKPGCMSTIESTVMGLEIMEPETEGLDKLLDVFDYMMEDQKVCMGERYTRLEEKVRVGRWEVQNKSALPPKSWSILIWSRTAVDGRESTSSESLLSARNRKVFDGKLSSVSSRVTLGITRVAVKAASKHKSGDKVWKGQDQAEVF